MGVVAHDVQFTRGNKARVSESDQDVVAWNIATQDATAPNELSLNTQVFRRGWRKAIPPRLNLCVLQLRIAGKHGTCELSYEKEPKRCNAERFCWR